MRSIGFKILFFWIISIIAIVAGVGALVMLLWNLLIPGIFGLATLNFWQALGLFLLSRILFSSFPFGGRRMRNKGRNPIREKWMKMTPEQQKEFIEKRRKFGFGNPFNREDFTREDSEESQQ